MADTNGWSEWSRHVLAELERLNDCYEKMNGEVTKVRISIGELKIKAGVWGLLGGLIPVAVIILIAIFTKK